jgi:hypothetical protein
VEGGIVRGTRNLPAVPARPWNTDSVEKGKALGSGLLYEQKREFEHGLQCFDRNCGSVELEALHQYSSSEQCLGIQFIPHSKHTPSP